MGFVLKHAGVQQSGYPVVFTHGVFEPRNLALRMMIERVESPSSDSDASARPTVLLVVDSALLEQEPTLPARVNAYFAEHADAMNWSGDMDVVPVSGNRAHDQNTVSRIQELILDDGLGESDVVLAMGGSRLLARAGFAVGTLRCKPRFIRIPATIEGQAYAALGVEHAIGFGRRDAELSIRFSPLAVLNDLDFLGALPPSQKQEGIATVALYALRTDAEAWDRLMALAPELRAGKQDAISNLVHKVAEAELETSRDDAQSRPLSCVAGSRVSALPFATWLAEELLRIEPSSVSWAQALWVGMAVDSHYAFSVGAMSSTELHRVFRVLEAMDYRAAVPELALFAADGFDDFADGLLQSETVHKLGLEEVGREVDVGLVDVDTLRSSIDAVITVAGVSRAVGDRRALKQTA